ncbi:hypothetical protein GCM10010522_30440 [Kribbella solani]
MPTTLTRPLPTERPNLRPDSTYICTYRDPPAYADADADHARIGPHLLSSRRAAGREGKNHLQDLIVVSPAEFYAMIATSPAIGRLPDPHVPMGAVCEYR